MPSKSYVTAHTPEASSSPSRHPFEDVDTLRSSDGVKAVISQRRANGSFTFALFREFEHDGAKQQGAFFPEAMALSVLRMTELAIKRMQEMRKTGKTGKNEPLPFAIR